MSDIIRDYFDDSVEAFDEGYQDVSRRYHLIRRQEVILQELGRLAVQPNSKVWMDAGCGAGLLACAIAERGFRIYGVDFAAKMVERAKENAKKAGLVHQTDFCQAGLAELPFQTKSMSGIVCAGVIEYCADPIKVLAEFARLLIPRGVLIVTFNNSHSPFRWVSGPGTALALRIAGRKPAFEPKGYSILEASRLLEHARFKIIRWRRHTYALQLKSLWVPPLPVARQLERFANYPMVRELGWGLVAVGELKLSNEFHQ